MGWLRMGVRWCFRGKIDAEHVGQVGVAGRVQPHSPRAGLASYAAIVQEMLEQRSAQASGHVRLALGPVEA